MRPSVQYALSRPSQPVPAGASGPLRLADLKVYEWSFDPLRQRLSVKLFKTGDNANLKDFATRRAEGSESRPLLALRLDYDLTATLAQGRSNAGIARQLWVTEGTVEKHVHSILRKLRLPETGDDHRRVLAVIAFLDTR